MNKTRTNWACAILGTIGLVTLLACSEAAGDDDAAGGAAGDAGTSGASGANANGSAGAAGSSAGSGNTGGTESGAAGDHAGGTAGTSGNAGAAGAGAGALVINEISADKSDFIELFNAGTVTLQIGGYQIADLDSTAGGPKIADAIKIPDGTTLSPGAYLVIDANNAAPKEGLQNDCPESGASECLQAGFGLSAGDGDEVFVLDGEGNILLQATIPADAAPKPASWCRLPNGTGDFALCASTPGAENAAP